MTAFNLAYENGRFHPRGMAVPVLHSHPPDPDDLIKVPGIEGEVATDLSMLLYLREFERRIAALPAGTVWDATGAGARKQGALVVDDATVLAKCGGLSKPDLSVVQSGGMSERKFNPDDALCAWHDASGRTVELIDRLFSGECPTPDKLADGLPAILKNIQPAHLIDSALNPRLNAELYFALQDFKLTGKNRPGEPSVQDVATRFSMDLRRITELVFEITGQIAIPDGMYSGRVMLLSPLGQLPPRWVDLERWLKSEGIDVVMADIDPDNFPKVWRQARRSNTDVFLTWDDTVMPAAWNLPGHACLNLRFDNPPGTAEFNQTENWMLGYAVVGMAPDIADAWREKIPSDRPVYLCRDDGQLASLQDNMICGWRSVIAELLRENI